MAIDGSMFLLVLKFEMMNLDFYHKYCFTCRVKSALIVQKYQTRKDTFFQILNCNPCIFRFRFHNLYHMTWLFPSYSLKVFDITDVLSRHSLFDLFSLLYSIVTQYCCMRVNLVKMFVWGLPLYENLLPG